MNQHSEKVTLTRRRWDAYMALLFFGALAIAIVRVWQSSQLRFAVIPLTVVPIWLMLRLQTPRDGVQSTTIRNTPGAVVLLGFIAVALITMAILIAVDIYALGHAFRDPLEPYHVALFLPPFIIMLIGAFWADRIAKTQRALASRRDDEQSL